jgi:hypothetical protein
MHMMTTQKLVRAAFWDAHPDANRKLSPDRDYCTDTRCAFIDFIDSLHRDGQISAALAHRATLSPVERA